MAFGDDPNGSRARATDQLRPSRQKPYSSHESYAFAYTPAHRLSGVTDGAGRQLSFTYNPVGWLDSATETAGGQSFATTYDYDAAGRVTSLDSDAAPAVTYAYDLAGRLASLTLPGSGAATFAHDDLLPDLLPKYMVTVGTRWYLLGLAAAPLYQRVPTSPNSHRHFQDSNSLGGTIKPQVTGLKFPVACLKSGNKSRPSEGQTQGKTAAQRPFQAHFGVRNPESVIEIDLSPDLSPDFTGSASTAK